MWLSIKKTKAAGICDSIDLFTKELTTPMTYRFLYLHRLSIHEHSTALHLFGSSLISLKNIS